MEMDYLPVSPQKQEPTEDTGTPIEEPQIREVDAYSIAQSEQTPLGDPPPLPDHLFRETELHLQELQKKGLDDNEIAEIMGIAKNTLERYKSRTERKKRKFYALKEESSEAVSDSPEQTYEKLPPDLLSERQKQVEDLRNAGLKAKEIGERLGITENTVFQHWNEIASLKRVYYESQGLDYRRRSYTDRLANWLPTDLDLSRLTERQTTLVRLIQEGHDDASIASQMGIALPAVYQHINNIQSISDETLTSKELELKNLLAQGLTYQEIADIHMYSYKSINNSASLLLRKLGVTDPTDLWTSETIEKNTQYAALTIDRSPNPERGHIRPDERLLTNQEYRLASLIVEQRPTNKELAELLGISLQTVNKHLSNIQGKLGQMNKDELTRDVIEQFKPHALYLEDKAILNDTDSVLTQSMREAQLPGYEYECIVPLQPQKILTENEIKVLSLIPKYPDIYQKGEEPLSAHDYESSKETRTYNEIATLLNISPQSVHNFLSTLLKKLNISSSSDAAQVYRYYKEQGLL